jgi:hypothetical protein
VSEPKTPLDEAIDAASDEVGLPTWYRSCVRPIVNAPPERWPRCCDSGCEPCNLVLCEVARRALAKLSTP